MARWYCFNTDCNRWGEAPPPWGRTGTGRTLELRFEYGKLEEACPECGGDLLFHDNWDRNERTHDNGAKVER